MTFDPSKPFQCKDGSKAEIYNIERKHGAVLYKGVWDLVCWENDWTHPLIKWELVNIPEEVTLWANVYIHHGVYFIGGNYADKILAESNAESDCITTVPVIFKVPS